MSEPTKTPLAQATETLKPEPPKLTIEHALIMLTYLVEQNFGEVEIPLSYLVDKVEGSNPATLDIFQTPTGSVKLLVKSDNVRTRILL